MFEKLEIMDKFCFFAVHCSNCLYWPFLPFIDHNLTERQFIFTNSGRIFIPPFAPSAKFPLGTDHNGVDLLSRVIVGTRETLYLMCGVIVVRYLLAIPLAIGGFYSRIIESVLKGWNQVFSFMPPIFFLSLFVGLPFIFLSSIHSVWLILILAILDVGRTAEIIHQQMKETQKRPI
ncbi:hypothetical protein RCG23_10195 [Neobacillus sp. PS3-34]|uniref:hypothetical protein n=1 Tax=Neobacillus sp. PS3-34 TaxID=3070678 RepID=UPI0027E1CB01|nr:hypothetical protein [Neobacillus sp. PS3-34]WML50156.1 hypothetical protein RCG23_10195 [Neobacillus sp. PS3-34]